MSLPAIDRTGKRYNQLVVMRLFERKDRGDARWLCKCDCGDIAIVQGGKLANGKTKSCGCIRRRAIGIRSLSHGHANHKDASPTYTSWCNMKARCTNPNKKGYENYGGRGITVCERWESFENFLEDMGERPLGKTIERINVNGNYEPGNCKWATRSEQERNKRRNIS